MEMENQAWLIDERAEYFAIQPEFQRLVEQIRNDVQRRREDYFIRIIGLDMGSGEDQTVWRRWLTMIEEYLESLEAEYERQLAHPDYDRWAVYSGTLNRRLRKHVVAIENDKRSYAMATVAFSLWQDYNAKLRGDQLDSQWSERVAEYIGVLKGNIDISQITGPLK